MANKTYKTMQGKTIDIDTLRQRNELTPAVGNARVNARGDELGPGGHIVRKREEVVNEYYQNNRPVPDEVPVRQKKEQPQADTNVITTTEPEPEQGAPKTNTKTRRAKKTEEEWTEDENGNFVKREDT